MSRSQKIPNFQIACLLCTTLLAGVLEAHPALDLRLRHINTQLAQQPDDAELLLARANLYREHGEPGQALTDLQQATTREPTLAEAWFARARIEQELGKTDEAMLSNTTFLKLQQQSPSSPATVTGLFQQGDIHRTAGRHSSAASSYQHAMAVSTRPSVEQYLLLADSEQQAGQPDAAIHTLDIAIQRHGEMPQLLEKAVAVELSRQQPEAALQWLDRLLQQPERHEYLLLQKARIQRSQPDEAGAQASLAAALLAIETLPGTRRYSEATLALEQEILREKIPTTTSNTPASASGK